VPTPSNPKLAGRRIVVTRSAEDCAEWADRLAAAGAEPVVYPCIRTEIVDTPALREALATAVAEAGWLVLTSRRGVEAFGGLFAGPLPARLRVAAVGPATAEAARARLGRVDLVGSGGTAAALGAELAAMPAHADGVIVAVAENAGGALEAALAQAGVMYRRFDVYRTVPAESREPKDALSALVADRVVYASPSAVAGFMNRVALDTALEAIAIGPSTSRALRAAGLAVAAEARAPKLDAIIDAIVESLDA
jgi:uroporphyrinogen-III synthase